MRIPNLSLYLRIVEFEFETECKFETENKIFHEYQPHGLLKKGLQSSLQLSREIFYLLLVFLLQSVHHFKILQFQLAPNQLSSRSLEDLCGRSSPLWLWEG